MKQDIEYAYIAGLTDGEGTIFITPQLYLSVKIRNTDKPILLWVQGVYGLGKIYKAKSAIKQGFSLEFNSNNALKFLTPLLPYLRIKKLQAELAVAFQLATETGDRKIEYRQRIMALNQKSYDRLFGVTQPTV